MKVSSNVYTYACHLLCACSRIKITFPPELKRTGIQDVPVLAAGEVITMAIELVLSGLTGK